MKTYTLEQVLKELTNRKYLEPKSKIRINIDDDVYKTNVYSLHRNDSSLLLAPVMEVYISIGDTNDRRRLLIIWDYRIDYLVTTASIKKAVNEMFGDKLDSVYSGYTLTFICRKLPDIFLDSFLYQEGFMSPDVYLTLTRYRNTIMSGTMYSKCMYWIKKHKKYVIKQYRLKIKGVDDEAQDASKLLEDVVSIVAGFKVQIRAGVDGVLNGYFVIEAVK